MPTPRLDAASSPSSPCPSLRQSILGAVSLCRSTWFLPGMLQGSAAEWGPPGAPAGSPLPSRPGATASGSPPAPPGSEPFITQRGAGWEQSGSMGNELLEPCSFPGCHYRCQNQHGARAAGTAQQLGCSWPAMGRTAMLCGAFGVEAAFWLYSLGQKPCPPCPPPEQGAEEPLGQL